MKNPTFLAALLLVVPAAAMAQSRTTTTKPAPTAAATPKPGTEQVTEVTEDLDPATGKVIRRTTRTTTVPVGTAPRPAATPTNSNAGTTETVSTGAASDTAVSSFFRERTAVARLTAPQLLDAYNRFIEKVRDDRRGWKPAEWDRAAAVLSSLNGRYEQLRSGYTLDDKLTVRGVQGEFQALRTARQISTSVSDKL